MALQRGLADTTLLPRPHHCLRDPPIWGHTQLPGKHGRATSQHCVWGALLTNICGGNENKYEKLAQTRALIRNFSDQGKTFHIHNIKEHIAYSYQFLFWGVYRYKTKPKLFFSLRKTHYHTIKSVGVAGESCGGRQSFREGLNEVMSGWSTNTKNAEDGGKPYLGIVLKKSVILKQMNCENRWNVESVSDGTGKAQDIKLPTLVPFHLQFCGM